MKKNAFLRILVLGMFFQNFVLHASEYSTIFTAWLKNPLQMGEMLPLSQVVCEEITHFVKIVQLKNSQTGCYYLDVGAGTGAVSAAVIRKLRPCDRLDLIEIDPKLCEFLKKRFAKYSNVHVHCCSVLDFKPTCRYDVILSTLPFNSFSVDFAQKTIQLFKEISNDGCITTYVECSIVRNLLQYFYHTKKKKSFISIQNYFKNLRSQSLKRYKTIYYNFTPIDVYHLEL